MGPHTVQSVDCSPYMFNILRCPICCRPSTVWITFNGFLTIFDVFVPHFYLYCTHCIVLRSLLNHPNSFLGGVFKFNTKFDLDLLLYWLSHFECDGNTGHILTQWCLLPPLTRTVKLSLFIHAHSSPLFLAARLHQCHANCSLYFNNGWTFSRQTLYTPLFFLSVHHCWNLGGLCALAIKNCGSMNIGVQVSL